MNTQINVVRMLGDMEMETDSARKVITTCVQTIKMNTSCKADCDDSERRDRMRGRFKSYKPQTAKRKALTNTTWKRNK